MVIQPLLFPPYDLINEPELFFRGIAPQNIYKDKVVIPAGSTVSLETYFNAFSIGKWHKYTNLDNLSLNLKIEGDIEIVAYHAVGATNTSAYNDNPGKYTEEEFIEFLNKESYSAVCEKTVFSFSHFLSVPAHKGLGLPQQADFGFPKAMLAGKMPQPLRPLP